MSERILAVVLLITGGAVTLYVLYKTAVAALEPLVQKKLEQQMQRDKLNQVQNNLTLGRQLDQKKVQDIKKNMK